MVQLTPVFVTDPSKWTVPQDPKCQRSKKEEENYHKLNKKYSSVMEKEENNTQINLPSIIDQNICKLNPYKIIKKQI